MGVNATRLRTVSGGNALILLLALEEQRSERFVVKPLVVHAPELGSWEEPEALQVSTSLALKS